MTDMFSRDEAFELVSSQLKVRDAHTRMVSDRRGLLDDIVTAMQTELVFQNIVLLHKSLEERRRPSLEDIKRDYISGVGGLCYNLNVAAFYILKAIGYNASLVKATCTSTIKFPNNHVVVHVKDVEKHGDCFLVEVGFGFPTWRAISLDFDVESPVYRDSFIEYKYIKHEGEILRMHRQGDLAPKKETLVEGLDFIVDGWRRFYYSDLNATTSDIGDFDADFDAVFCNPTTSPFHSSLRVIGFPNKRATMVVNNKKLIENDEGQLVATVIPGDDDAIIAEVLRLFPVFTEPMVRQAVFHWRETTKS